MWLRVVSRGAFRRPPKTKRECIRPVFSWRWRSPGSYNCNEPRCGTRLKSARLGSSPSATMRRVRLTPDGKWYGPTGHSGMSLVVASLVVIAVAGGLVFTGHWGAGVGWLLIAAMIVISVRWPLVSLSALLLAAYLPEALMFAAARQAPTHSGSWGQPFAGLQLSDIVLLGMLAATCLIVLRGLLASDRSHRAPRIPPMVWLPFGLFVCWLGIEVARNVGRFGISAPGEFRFEYLGLAVVPYLCVVARDTSTQRRLILVLLIGTLFVPLALVPVIGSIKGWYVGPNSRFFPADVSLGIFYGAGALVLAKARRAVAAPTWLVALTVCLAGVFVFVDANRSVWMAGAAAVVVAALLRAFPRRSLRWDGVAVAAAVCASLAVSWVALAALPIPAPGVTSTSPAHSNPLAYVQTRGLAYVDPSADADSSWRLALWHSAFRQIRAVPVVGVGFGGYWRFPMPHSINNGSPVTVAPHDVYIQTWLKTGGIGLVLYLATVAGVLAYLFRAWIRTRLKGEPTSTLLLIIGVTVLISSSLYMVVYSFATAPLMWTGLALGAAATQVPARSHLAEGVAVPPDAA